MRKATLLFLVVFFALPALAQQSVAEAAALARSSNQASADSPTRDQVMTLLELLQVRKTMSVMLESMKKVMIDGAERGFREKVPNPTPKQLAALHGMFDDIVNASMDDMINALVPIYQRHLTKADLEELIRFYSSPVGQKLLREQPQMMQEGMQAGMQVQQKRMGEIRAKIDARIDKMMEEGSGKSSPPKQ